MKIKGYVDESFSSDFKRKTKSKIYFKRVCTRQIEQANELHIFERNQLYNHRFVVLDLKSRALAVTSTPVHSQAIL